MSPDDIIKAAERVRDIVKSHEQDPYSVPNLIDILKQLPELPPRPPFPPGDCSGFRAPQTTACPNFPNPCYCTGACLRLGISTQRPQRPYYINA